MSKDKKYRSRQEARQELKSEEVLKNCQFPYEDVVRFESIVRWEEASRNSRRALCSFEVD